MSKRIVFCSDGTWDNSGKNTNVYKIFKGLQTTADQVPFYDDGVGSDGLPLEKLAGGAFGAGLFQKIKDGYSKISQVYEKGDEVFLFGFSRGAYTARCLAGMIAVCGLPTEDFSDDVVDKAFQAYRFKNQRADLLADLNKACDLFDAKLSMVGVWDTVGSLGIPAIFGGVSPLVYGFLDTTLHPNVLHAYHALAIDERRCEFPATLWDSPAPGQTLEQVWFCGVHCDVGGSYPDDPDGTALADLTLAWMIGKAASLGLTFDPGVQTKYALPMDPKCALDTKHESWNIGWTFPKRREIAPNSSIADSVFVRCEHDSSYRPDNLSFAGNDPASGYRKVPVVTQTVTAAGSV
ncbi:MAG TPA: DUF2235 domain-containing protein [Bryobacteraceae bacterium]|jgi:uncharacterized protein (DUF2235 family)|nr:DUF2235 domain-containing protein [Bryobacteraceae bacterium]